jgi:hypothetical protein
MSKRTTGLTVTLHTHPFLDHLLEVWGPLRAELAALEVSANERISAEHRTLGIELECAGVLGVAQAWEHAECLDFTYVLVPSKASGILFAGPCKSRAEAAQRLRDVCAFVQQHRGG